MAKKAITATGIPAEGMPYLTKLEDEKGRSIVVHSSRMETEYLSPSQLLGGALAGCMSMTVKGELFRNGVAYEDVAVTVETEEDEQGVIFTYSVEVTSDAPKDEVDTLTKKACENCYVRGLLSSDIRICGKGQA